MSSTNYLLEISERQRNGKSIVEDNKLMLRCSADIIGENDSKMVLKFRDYFVEVYFSNIHPLMVIRLVKFIDIPDCYDVLKIANDLNKDCLYGFHCYDYDVEKKRYYFQTVQWLDCVLSYASFFERLEIYAREAEKFLTQL